MERPLWFTTYKSKEYDLKKSVEGIVTKLGYLADVTKTGMAGAGNERKERESEKWEQKQRIGNEVTAL